MGRRAPAPPPRLRGLRRTDGLRRSHSRQVREAGVVHRIFVRRVRCATVGPVRCWCRTSCSADASTRRLRSAQAVLTHVRCGGAAELTDLYGGVPARTVRSWRQRFSERANDLTIRFEALRAAWGAGGIPGYEPTPVAVAITPIGFAGQATGRRPASDVPPPWRLANIAVGGRLLGTRVDLPWPIVPTRIGRTTAPDQHRSAAASTAPDTAGQAVRAPPPSVTFAGAPTPTRRVTRGTSPTRSFPEHVHPALPTRRQPILPNHGQRACRQQSARDARRMAMQHIGPDVGWRGAKR